MKEPHLSEFKRLIRDFAASRDIHDSASGGGFAAPSGEADEDYVAREVERHDAHRRSLNPMLERYVGGARRILDFGCGTGGTTVAMALSALGADEVVGVDANAGVLEAAAAARSRRRACASSTSRRVGRCRSRTRRSSWSSPCRCSSS